MGGRLASEAVERWQAEERDQITVGRRVRVGRRRPTRGPGLQTVVIAVVVLLVGLGVAGYFWFTRPSGLATLPDPAVVAPGGFQAAIGDEHTITVGLEVRNTADQPLRLTSARIVPPPGVTMVAVTLVPPGEGNRGFDLSGDLPAMAPVDVGIDATDRNAVVAARFTVDCDALVADAASPEQIFVTIEFERQTREEELTPPVVDDIPWLAGSARQACTNPEPAGSPEPPLPPLPDATAGATGPAGG